MINNRKKNFSKWYNEIVIKSGLSEFSGIRGFMILKPYGYSIWNIIKNELDKILKKTGHENVYFPILIPKSILLQEKKHSNFSKDGCAIVTHYKIKKDEEKKIAIDKTSKLKEELIIRPTSESIIWKTYKKWIKSYKDLPILLNQWGNAVRWEMRPRLFLRTNEFLWQEGHTAHSSKNEAIKEAEKILDIYTKFLERFMAIPVIQGIKPNLDKFYGSEKTYCIEALMQDGKSLQIGTSHFLGQNFSKAFNVKFTNFHGKKEYVWSTSWGVSTRLIGGLIMSHSDDNGLILPPKVSPIQVIIIPIYKKKGDNYKIDDISKNILESLEKIKIRVKYDNNKIRTPGWKFNEYELKGIPIRISIGLNEIKRNNIELFRRDTLKKISIPLDRLQILIPKILEKIQNNLYIKALKRTKKFTLKINNYKDFKEKIKNTGGYILSHWDGTEDTSKKIQEETEASIRCIPISPEFEKKSGKCIFSGKFSSKRVIFSKSY